MRIAILEDDVSQLELLSHWLRAAGHEPHAFEQGEALLQAFAHQAFDLLVLDWNVPGLDGVEVLKRVRQTSQVPVLFCTSNGGQDNVVKVLRAGADDYVVKPARQLEFLARIDAVARRGRKRDGVPESFEVAEFHFNFEGRTILRHGSMLEISAKDFDLAALFLRNINHLLSRAHITQAVWGDSASQSRTVDTHVSRIRTRLGLIPEHGWRLGSVYRHGYRLERCEPPALLVAQRTAFPAVQASAPAKAGSPMVTVPEIV